MRKVSILFVIVGLLVMSGVVSAQDMMPVVCGSLSPDDCNILQQSATAMGQLKSADTSLSLTITGENVDEEMPGTSSLSVTGTGAFAGDLAALRRRPENMNDPAALTNYLTALKGFSAELNLMVTLPPEAAQQAAAHGVTLPEGALPLNLKLVDGKGYVDFTQFSQMMSAAAAASTESPESTPSMIPFTIPNGWGGVDFIEIATGFQTMMQQMQEAFADFGNMDATEEATVEPTIVPEATPSVMEKLMNPELLNKYVTVERLPDAQVDGATVAVFKTTVNLAGLLSDPDVQSIMAGSSSERAANAAAALEQHPDALTVTITKQIDTSSFFVRSQSTDITANLTALDASDEDATPVPADALPRTATINAQYSLSNFNGGQTIAAPEGATLITFNEIVGGIFQMMMGSMGGSDSEMDSSMDGFDTDMNGLDSMADGFDTDMAATPAASG